jgi:L-arabinose isomerase
MNINYKHLRVGLMGVGLEAYWEQFEGLEARLLGYLSEIEQKVSGPNRLLFNLGLVDTPQRAIEYLYAFGYCAACHSACEGPGHFS